MIRMKNSPTLFSIGGFGFPEALRWRNNELWFSDMFRGNVYSWDPRGKLILRLSQNQGGPEMPGGLGWTPEGHLLVVDCLEKKVLKIDDSGLVTTRADLSDLTEHPLNDMHVDSDGTAWVGGYGFNPENQEPVGSPIYKVSQNGNIQAATAEFVFPNGCERLGSEIAVAETFADRVSFFDDEMKITKSFSCAPGSGPDGLSFGPDGDLFVAAAFTGEITKFDTGGTSDLFYKLENSDTDEGGARGIFDCAVHLAKGQIAFSSACLDEDYSMKKDTGSITVVSL